MPSTLDFSKLPLAMFLALAGCASAEPEDLVSQPADEESESLELAADTSTGGASTYYAIAADLRKCAAPLCGGWHLERLNRTTTRCQDGRYAASCYTPVLDWTESNLSETQQAVMIEACNEGALSEGVYAIVRGRFAATNATPMPELGRFVVAEAWVAEGEGISDGRFVRVRDNGLRCLVAPCPSYTETVLNTSVSTDIAEVDFSPSGLSATEIDECIESMATPDGVLMSGYRYTVDVDGRTAKGRTVTAAYDRLSDAAP